LWRADSGKNTTSFLIFQVQNWWEFCKISQSTACPLTSKTDENVDRVKQLVLRQRIAIHDVAGMLRVLFGLVKSILKDDLKVCRAATKFKPHLLSEEQKENCVNVFQNLQDSLHNTPHLVPCEFFLFPKLKVVLIVWRYNVITMIQGKSRNGLGKFQPTSQCFM
jgi:hypothetical protein